MARFSQDLEPLKTRGDFKAADSGRVEACLVVVQIELPQELLAGIAKAAAGGGVGLAVRTVGVDRRAGARAVGGGHDGAQVVSVQNHSAQCASLIVALPKTP